MTGTVYPSRPGLNRNMSGLADSKLFSHILCGVDG